MEPFRWQDGDLVLQCHIQPKASRDEFAGIHDSRLKIRITAPPVDGKANKHLCKFIAKQFAVAGKAVTVISGETSRKKTLRINAPQLLPADWNITW